MKLFRTHEDFCAVLTMKTNQIQPIHRKDVTSGIVENILKMIGDGYWIPGERLPSQRKLASQMDVSMASLREALYSLQAMGVLEMKHGSGTYVSQNTVNPGEKLIKLSLLLGGLDIKMFFEARRVIETGLSRLAAEHGTDEQISRLFEILEEQNTAFDDGDQDQLHELDLAFHKLIADMANNNFLFQINETLFANLDKLFQVLPFSKNGWSLHYAVAEAIRNRDSDNAYLTTRALIEATFANYLPYIEKFEQQ